MFWALLVHRQGLHSCIKQSSNSSVIPSMYRIATRSSVYEYEDVYVHSKWSSP
jgi:hypothetical protein